MSHAGFSITYIFRKKGTEKSDFANKKMNTLRKYMKEEKSFKKKK